MTEESNPVIPGGMKATFTSDGRSTQRPLTEEEAAELYRQGEAWEKAVADVLTHEASLLNEHCDELLANGTTTIVEPNGQVTATLRRSRWRDGWLATEGHMRDGNTFSGGHRIARKTTEDYVRRVAMHQLADGVRALREE